MTKVTIYKNVSDTSSQSYYDFSDVLKIIKSGDSNLRQNTLYLRSIVKTNPTEYANLKKQFPMVASSGEFKYRNSNPSSLLSYSNIVVADLDWNDHDPSIIEGKKELLIQYANRMSVYAVWKSLGHGLKVAILHDNTDPYLHSELVKQIKAKLFSKTPQFDEKCKDLSRTFFMSYDPDVWINPSPQLTPFHFDVSLVTPASPTQTASMNYGSTSFTHTQQELEMNAKFQSQCSDKTLMNMLIGSFNAKNPDYYRDGNRHSEVLKRATLYCKDGILYDNALWSLQGQFGPNSRAGLSDSDIKSMVTSCYNKRRGDFGKDRRRFLDLHQAYKEQKSSKNAWPLKP